MSRLDQPHLFEPPPRTSLTLNDRFLVPPFSVLDARAGYWQDRKREWMTLGIKSELGREENLIGYSERSTLQGTSNTSTFDPVLCELVYRWFAPDGGLVLDPFAGGSVRGIVAAHLGRQYLGVDLRPEQVESNLDQAATMEARRDWPYPPTWICGDSVEVLPTLRPDSADLVFSCPPYYDLEQYSDDPRDLSNAGDYRAFLAAYRAIIANAVRTLRPDRFAVFLVGEVRLRDGSYAGLIPDTIAAFQDAGASYYNEAILVTMVGSLSLRIGRGFGAGRKIGKTHQNVLCFVKGDRRRAADACPMPDEVAIEYGGASWALEPAGARVTLGDEQEVFGSEDA
jgi:DNA modification methylase